ncbi:probable G-protein coupled receptor Mth-like 6 [Onthophagus taurus]|uniref:probable G-protein coupled receptor Mth-like 6 n=1 Tax=Onthophagus taurus TaxID=166361 RepID=UPI0039BDE909
MFSEFLVISLLFTFILSTTSLYLNEIINEFKTSNILGSNFNNCIPAISDSHKFSFKQDGVNYELSDVCNGLNLNELSYFPKCCPLGYNYKSQFHSCVKNEDGIYSSYDIESNVLVKSFLDCPVIIDQIISNKEVIHFENKTIFINNTKSYHFGSYCLDWDFEISSSVLRTCEKIERCRSLRCITKCCKDGFSYLYKNCVFNPEYGVSIKDIKRFQNQSDSFSGVVQKKVCKKFKDSPKYNFTIKSNGNLLIKQVNKWFEYEFEEKMYCLDYLTQENRYAIFICSFGSVDVPPFKIALLKPLNIISCISLILTILGFIFLKELKNFVGNIIISYCSCLLIESMLATYIQFNLNHQKACIPLGLLIMFFLLAAFAWMNLLSFEIWHTLGSMMTHYGTKLHDERKKFIYYNIYAWSVPTFLLTFQIMSYHTEIIPNSLKPVIGLRQCFIEGDRIDNNYGYFIYLIIPSSIYIILNLIFFFKTVRYIFKVKKDLQEVQNNVMGTKQKRFHLDKERTLIVLRIFVIMGITWLFEFIQTIQIDFSQHIILRIIETTFDILSTLHGFLIFCVFMAKKTIWIAVKRKFNLRSDSRLNSSTTLRNI